jgi:hypothetical protein
MEPSEKISRGLSCLFKQIGLLTQAQEHLLAQTTALGPVLTFMIYAISDSCDTLGVLVQNGRIRDAFVTGRTIYLTIVNACFMCAEGDTSAERALRHAQQKAYRDLHREAKVNERRFELRYLGTVSPDPSLLKAVQEFTGSRGQEVREWTSESVTGQLERIDSKYGGILADVLMLGFILIYRHSSEIAHGTLFGTLWSLGVTEPRKTLDYSKAASDHAVGTLGSLLYLLNSRIFTLVDILAKEFPTLTGLKDECSSLFADFRKSVPI